MRVLLVEDNRDTLVSLAAILRYEKFDLMTAQDGTVALELAKLFPPDVAVVDIGLPGMDGYQVAKALRRQRANSEALYIAAMTGYGKSDDKQRAIAAGIDAHFTKPTAPSAIIELLRKVESRQQTSGLNRAQG